MIAAPGNDTTIYRNVTDTAADFIDRNRQGCTERIKGANMQIIGFIRGDASPVVVPAVSVSLTVKLKSPVVSGTPLIAPVAPLSVRPGGRAPPIMDQLYGDVPPAAARVAD